VVSVAYYGHMKSIYGRNNMFVWMINHSLASDIINKVATPTDTNSCPSQMLPSFIAKWDLKLYLSSVAIILPVV